MSPAIKRSIAVVGLLGSLISFQSLDTNSPAIWGSIALLFVSFYSIFRYTNQIRQEQGLGSMAPGVSRFLLRFLISLFITAGAILALILFVYLLHHLAGR